VGHPLAYVAVGLDRAGNAFAVVPPAALNL